MTAAAGAARPRLRRDRERGWLAGVAAGIAGRFGIDPVLVRLAFVVATAAGGAGVAIYALAWLVVPAGDSAPRERAPSPRGRAAVEVALGTGLLLLSVLLAFRGLGIWFSDAIVWPVVLIATGGVLIWRQSLGSREEPAAPDPRPRAPTAAGGARSARGRPLGGRRVLPHRRRRGSGDRGRASPSSTPPAPSAPPGTCCWPRSR